MLLVGCIDGDDGYLISKAKEYSSSPILVTEENWQEFIVDSDAVGYTSIAEFPNNKKSFCQLLIKVNNILYCPSPNYSVDFRRYTEYLLFVYGKEKTINLIENLLNLEKINKDLDSMLKLVDHRQTTESQFWFAGCSITHGLGVDIEQRYGRLVANRCKKTASYLTDPGSSIPWAADQIIRSDIRKNDIVVWGLTEINRYPYYIPNQSYHINTWSYNVQPNLEKIVPMKLLVDDDQLLYATLTSINRVINFCDKVGANLLLFGLLVTHKYRPYLYNQQNFYHYDNSIDDPDYLDLGTDNAHPGPKHHELYAEAVIQQLKKRNWI